MRTDTEGGDQGALAELLHPDTDSAVRSGGYALLQGVSNGPPAGSSTLLHVFYPICTRW